MADAFLVGGKKLNELRVVDLRQELEKRGLEKSGVKAVLVERLQKSLIAQAALEKEDEEEKPKDDTEEVLIECNEEQQEKEQTTEQRAVADSESEPKDLFASPKRAAKPAKKYQKKKGTLEKDEENIDEMEDASDDEISQESLDGEEVIMKIIDECQDDPQDGQEEDTPMEVTDYIELEQTVKVKLEESESQENVAKDEEKEEIKTELDVPCENESKEISSIEVEKEKDEDVVDEPEVAAISSTNDTSLEDNKADSSKAETSAMDTSEADTSKENSLSVSLFVHTDGVQDDLDEELKAAEKAEEDAAKEAKDGQEQEKPCQEKEEGSKEEVEDQSEKSDEKMADTPEKPAKSEVKTSTDTKEASKPAAKKTSESKKPAKKTTEKTPDGKTKGTPTGKEKKESGKSLWVSNLSSVTRAADLKTRFSQHGKVVGAKIVTNSKAPGAQCFGLVTMSTSEEAAKCISHLHRTELHGRTITVDRAKGDRIPTQSQGSAAAKKLSDKKQADKKASDKASEKAKADNKKQADKGKKPNEKASKPAAKTASGSSPSSSKKDETKDKNDRVVLMDNSKGEPVVVVSNKATDDSKSRSTSGGRHSHSSEKSAGSPIKSLDEIRRQRMEKQRQERAREMREQRERERNMRIRRERERIARERAVERERERERERDRERRRQMFLREQKNKQEQERLRLQRELERRRELERLRREREERERLERERRDREVILERERIQRERLESDRLQRERLDRERQERQRLERDRIDRERIDRDRLERMERERRGAGLKRPAPPFERDSLGSQRAGFWQDAKRPAVTADTRPDFFGGSLNPSTRRSEDKVPVDRHDSKGHSASRSGSRDSRRDEDFPRANDRHKKDDHSRRGDERGMRDSRKDIRHVSDRDKGWAERITSASSASIGPIDPQKSLSILLERAGVSGILGNNGAGVRADLGKNIELELGRSMSSGHRDWRQGDPRDSRPPVMQSERGAHVSVIDVRPQADARYGRAMEHAHRNSAVVGSEPVKVTSRDWRGEQSAALQARQRDLLDSRGRTRGRGIDSKSSAHMYESRDRGALARASGSQRGTWTGNPLHPSGQVPSRGLIEERARGSAVARSAVPPTWGSVGSMPVADVRNAYSSSAGPDRRHSGGTDVRYDPYKAQAQRSGGVRRY